MYLQWVTSGLCFQSQSIIAASLHNSRWTVWMRSFQIAAGKCTRQYNSCLTSSLKFSFYFTHIKIPGERLAQRTTIEYFISLSNSLLIDCYLLMYFIMLHTQEISRFKANIFIVPVLLLDSKYNLSRWDIFIDSV